jgi:hypothetical protein
MPVGSLAEWKLEFLPKSLFCRAKRFESFARVRTQSREKSRADGNEAISGLDSRVRDAFGFQVLWLLCVTEESVKLEAFKKFQREGGSQTWN